MMNKSALIIDTQNSAELLQETLRNLGFKRIIKINLKSLIDGFNIEAYDFIFYNCDGLNEKHLHLILTLAKKQNKNHFIILAKQISVYAYRQVAFMKNIMALQAPHSLNLLPNIMTELIHSDSFPMQRFPRFVTDEPVRVVVMQTGLLIPTRMLNYSVGGALFDYNGISLRVGHDLKVNLINQENPPAKNGLQLDARVVWVNVKKDEEKMESARGVGVQFNDLLHRAS